MSASAARDVGVVIVAGGSGTRTGGDGAQAVSLGRRQADAAAQRADVHGAPGRRHGRLRAAAALRRRSAAVALPVRRRPAARVGRRTRRAARACANGLEDLPDEASIVLVHDAARPLVGMRRRSTASSTTVRGGTSRHRRAAGRRHAQGGRRETARSCARSTATRLWRAQTPQGFPRAMIVRRAPARAAPSASRRPTTPRCASGSGMPVRGRARERARA